MSDTPRTDKEAFPGEWEDEVVSAEFAREIETELTAVTEQRDRLAEALESIVGESAYEGLPESKQQAIEQALDCTCECPIPNHEQPTTNNT
jgi:hypothetical protein